MSIADPTSNSSTKTITKRDYEILERNYLKLKEVLTSERARSNKFRRYIARLNQHMKNSASKAEESTPDTTYTSFTPSLPTAEQNLEQQGDLTKVVSEQGSLLEKLYNENRQQEESINRTSQFNRQLVVANDKLRRSLIALKRQAKPKTHSATTSPATPQTDLLPLSQRLKETEAVELGNALDPSADHKDSSKAPSSLFKDLIWGLKPKNP